MKHKSLQRELPCAGAVFNLAGERGIDPLAEAMERARTARRLEEAGMYEAKMQRKLSECPGFVGAEAPSGPSCSGKVVVEPALALEAVAWLRKRYHVAENIGLSSSQGLCVEVKPRARGRSGGPRRRVSFAPVEQFELPLA